MNQTRSARIREAFGKAHSYDSQATVQAATARRLAGLILERGLPDGTHALDMGCGTGVLAAHLLASGKLGRYLCADIAPAMLDRARAKLLGLPAEPYPADVPPGLAWPHPLFAVMDAAAPALKPGFHLAASNMALHWTANLGAVVAGLWKLVLPGGMLAVAIPGENTFRAWREAHERLILPCGLQDFPSAESFSQLFPVQPLMIEETHLLNLKHALDLPRHLKAVGGHVPRAGHKPLSPGQFRAVLAELDKARPPLGYHVLYALALKPGLG